MIEKLNNGILYLCAWMIVGVTLIGGGNAVARYIGRYIGEKLGSNLFIELQWYLFSAIFLLGGVVTFYYDKHIRVDVFYSKFSEKIQKRINIFSTLFLLLPFAAIMVFFSSKYFERSYLILEQSPNPDGLPRYIVKFLIPLSFSLLFLQGVAYLFTLLGKRKKHEQHES